eukprot:GHVO01040497.1.p1 GENE.GHVO01040497.1~~GHVO01040497.1.p1  ORF type:complete len:454 (+),score=46.44 GHVO01040497.1:114-1475(+)
MNVAVDRDGLFLPIGRNIDADDTPTQGFKKPLFNVWDRDRYTPVTRSTAPYTPYDDSRRFNSGTFLVPRSPAMTNIDDAQRSQSQCLSRRFPMTQTIISPPRGIVRAVTAAVDSAYTTTNAMDMSRRSIFDDLTPYTYTRSKSVTPSTYKRSQSAGDGSSYATAAHPGHLSMDGNPTDSVRRVEVPVMEEKIVHVPRKEQVIVETRRPVYQVEWVEKIVEVPTIEYITKEIEVPIIQDVIKHVSVKQIVDVAKEIVRYVPKIETVIIEKEVPIPGEFIEVPKPFLVENKIVVPRFTEVEQPVVVAQSLFPIIHESDPKTNPNDPVIEVEVHEFVPKIVPLDVYIPMAVMRTAKAKSIWSEHTRVDIPQSHMNELVSRMNEGFEFTGGYMIDSQSKTSSYIPLSVVPLIESVPALSKEGFERPLFPHSISDIGFPVAAPHSISDFSFPVATPAC